MRRSKRSHSARASAKKTKSKEDIAEPIAEPVFTRHHEKGRLEKSVSFSNDLNTQFEEDEDKYNEVRELANQNKVEEPVPEANESGEEEEETTDEPELAES